MREVLAYTGLLGCALACDPVVLGGDGAGGYAPGGAGTPDTGANVSGGRASSGGGGVHAGGSSGRATGGTPAGGGSARLSGGAAGLGPAPEDGGGPGAGGTASGGAGANAGGSGALPSGGSGGEAGDGGTRASGGGSPAGGGTGGSSSGGTGGSLGGGTGGSLGGGMGGSLGGTAGFAGCPEAGAAGCGDGGAPASGGQAGLGGTGGDPGSSGAAGCASAAGAGCGEGSGGTGGTIPEDAEPPTGAPITVMGAIEGHAVAGDLAGGVWCRSTTEGQSWTACNHTNPQRTTVLPGRPVTALWLARGGGAVVAVAPSAAEDVVVYGTGYVGATPWSSTALSGVTVYGVGQIPAADPWQIAITSGGLFESWEIYGTWYPADSPDRISAALVVPTGLLSGAWIGTLSGGLYQVDDPVNVPSTNYRDPMPVTLPAVPVTGITLDPVDPNNAYVTAASVDPTGLYVSRDNGLSFDPVSVPFPLGTAGVLSAVSVNPFAPRVLYLIAFTPDPVPLRSEDAGATWTVATPP